MPAACPWMGQRGSHGCQGEMDSGGVVGEGHSGAAGSSCEPSRGSPSVMLGIQFPLTTAHSSDESSSLSAAILRQQEVNVTFGS